MVFIVLLKAAIDFTVAVSQINRSPPLAAMFWGFFIADVGSAWLLLVKP